MPLAFTLLFAGFILAYMGSKNVSFGGVLTDNPDAKISASHGGGGSSSGGSPPPAGQGAGAIALAGAKGGLAFPIPGGISSEGRTDRGQDMEAKKAFAPFVAAADGIITAAETGFPGVRMRATSGPFAGHELFYGHTSAIARGLHIGQHVKAGQMLGRVGHQGASYDGSNKHLEFGVYAPGQHVAEGTHYTAYGQVAHDILHKYFPGTIGKRAKIG